MLIVYIIHVSMIQICLAPPFHLTKFELSLINQSGLTDDQKECRISVPSGSIRFHEMKKDMLMGTDVRSTNGILSLLLLVDDI